MRHHIILILICKGGANDSVLILIPRPTGRQTRQGDRFSNRICKYMSTATRLIHDWWCEWRRLAGRWKSECKSSLVNKPASNIWFLIIWLDWWLVWNNPTYVVSICGDWLTGRTVDAWMKCASNEWICRYKFRCGLGEWVDAGGRKHDNSWWWWRRGREEWTWWRGRRGAGVGSAGLGGGRGRAVESSQWQLD